MDDSIRKKMDIILQKLEKMETNLPCKAEPTDGYVILNKTKNLDELDIAEQKSINSQNSLQTISKIKKKIMSGINVCGIGSTILSVGGLLL